MSSSSCSKYWSGNFSVAYSDSYCSFEILVDLEMGLTVQSHVLFFSVKTDVSGKHRIFNAFVADYFRPFNCKLSELSILNIPDSISKHVFLSEALVI